MYVSLFCLTKNIESKALFLYSNNTEKYFKKKQNIIIKKLPKQYQNIINNK